MFDVLRPDVPALGELHILGNIDDNRARPAMSGHIEGLVQDSGEVIHVLHEVIVLGAGPGDADSVAFLEGVVADQVRGYLAREADHGDRIEERVRQPGHRVGGAGAGGDEHDAAFAGRTSIALGGVGRALLVADQNMLHLVLLENLVVDRQHRPSGVAEHMLHPLVGQRLQNNLSTRHFARSHGILSVSIPSNTSRRSRQQKRPPREPVSAQRRISGSFKPPGRRAVQLR